MLAVPKPWQKPLLYDPPASYSTTSASLPLEKPSSVWVKHLQYEGVHTCVPHLQQDPKAKYPPASDNWKILSGVNADLGASSPSITNYHFSKSML